MKRVVTFQVLPFDAFLDGFLHLALLHTVQADSLEGHAK